jgi:hypothetical protein
MYFVNQVPHSYALGLTTLPSSLCVTRFCQVLSCARRTDATSPCPAGLALLGSTAPTLQVRRDLMCI